MTHWLTQLLLYTAMQVGCFMLGLQINELLRKTYPSATVLPITLIALMFASAAWAIASPSSKRKPADFGFLRSWHFIFGTLVLSALSIFALRYVGFDLSRGKIILLLLQIACTTPVCYLIGREVSTWDTFRIRRSKVVQKSLAATVGIVFCVASVLVSELFCGFLLSRRPSGPTKEYRGDYLAPGVFFRHDPDLGTAIEENRSVKCELIIDGKTLWDVHYGTDEFGRRFSTNTAITPPDHFAVFFGCSFLFGEGSNDDQTIPSQFSQALPGYLSYNYGVPGYGPQHMLAIVESGRLASEVKEKHGVGFYLYLPEVHESRAIGEMGIVNGFGGDFPFYYLDRHGDLIRNGQFSNGRKLTNTIYSTLGKSRTRQYLGLNFPRRRPEHYQLTAAIVTRAAQLFKQQFPGSDFYLVVYPNTGHQSLPLLEAMKSSDVSIMDLSTTFDTTDSRYYFAGDGHPTPMANEMVAAALAKKYSALRNNIP